VKIPISKIGKLQREDIEADRGKGIVCYDDYARVCTVYTDTRRDIGDKSPYRMAKMFGGTWAAYNNHFVVQVAGCPLDCPYCYVDNLEPDIDVSAVTLVALFKAFRDQAAVDFKVPLNVFHLMGGAPAVYCKFWPELREELDHQGCEDVVLFSNTILVERHAHQVCPWEYMKLPRLIVEGCLKGTNPNNFWRNTGKDWFYYAVAELALYVLYGNFYLTLINHDVKDLPWVYSSMEKDRVDLLTVVEYKATKAKRAQYAKRRA